MADDRSSDDEVHNSYLSNSFSDESDSKISLESIIEDFLQLYTLHSELKLVNRNLEDKVSQLTSQLEAAHVAADIPAETVTSAAQEAVVTDSAILLTENLQLKLQMKQLAEENDKLKLELSSYCQRCVKMAGNSNIFEGTTRNCNPGSQGRRIRGACASKER